MEEGARIAVLDRDPAALEAAGKVLPPEQAILIAADVTSEEDVAGAIEKAQGFLGAIDIVFSNAGNFGEVKPIAEYSLETFRSVLDVHVTGAFLTAKHVVPAMRDSGSLIITSSVAGTRGDPGVYGYITAKHAQVGLMRCPGLSSGQNGTGCLVN